MHIEPDVAMIGWSAFIGVFRGAPESIAGVVDAKALVIKSVAS
jgi:hypothetical protein